MNFLDLLTRFVVAVEKIAEAQSLISGSVARAANAKATATTATAVKEEKPVKAVKEEAPMEAAAEEKPKRGPGRPAKNKTAAEDTEEPEKEYTKEELFATMHEFVKVHTVLGPDGNPTPESKKAGPDFLKKYGVVKLSTVDPKDYAKIITEAQKIINKKLAESSDDDMFGEAA